LSPKGKKLIEEKDLSGGQNERDAIKEML